MSAPLFSATAIRLFGHLVEGLEFDANSAAGGPFKGLLARLGQSSGDRASTPASEDSAAQEKGLAIALIFAFSADGEYCELDYPALFTVSGKGVDAVGGVETTGIALNKREFAPGLKVWTFDRSDFVVRLDFDVGTLEDLLDWDSEDANDLEYAGKKAGMRGKNVRMRFGGKNVRLRGGGLAD